MVIWLWFLITPAAHLAKKNDTKSIWDEEDVPETAAADADDLDPRPQPE